jgi:hypothetical protein
MTQRLTIGSGQQERDLSPFAAAVGKAWLEWLPPQQTAEDQQRLAELQSQQHSQALAACGLYVAPIALKAVVGVLLLYAVLQIHLSEICCGATPIFESAAATGTQVITGDHR